MGEIGGGNGGTATAIKVGTIGGSNVSISSTTTISSFSDGKETVKPLLLFLELLRRVFFLRGGEFSKLFKQENELKEFSYLASFDCTLANSFDISKKRSSTLLKQLKEITVDRSTLFASPP